jgi:tripartite-type tricarboxylate transporter receptor subunit TctC
MHKVRALTFGLLSLFVLTSANERTANAQSYPAKPVKIVVPYPPGGGVDAVARAIAPKLSDALGTQFYVENLPGAGGTIGAGAAARAPADGHTILFMNPDFVVQPIIKAKVQYDPFMDFTPVTQVGTAQEAIVVHPSVPANSMKDLIALLKANPGKYNFGSPGYGSSPHLAGERLFKVSHGLDVAHVPFQGGAPAITSTIAGHTSILQLSMPALSAHIRAGSLRALAVASDKRSPAFPDVPTLGEAGIPDHEVEYMVGVVVPAGTPKGVIDLLQQKIATIVALPEVNDRLAALGLETVGSTSDAFAAKLKADHATWSRVVREASITIQ